MRGRAGLLSATTSIVACWAIQAQAQDQVQPPVAEPEAQTIDDVVVTAQRRSESLQKVPVAVTAVTSEDLARSGIQDLAGVTAVVPNLNLGQQLGVAKISLRGIGLENISAGAEGSIAFHMDGVFVSRSIAALASFYDVQQVEVLRGPQGTLYGRNATGGSVNINTRKPTQELSGYTNVTAGNYGRIDLEGAISGAIVPDVLAGRLAFQTRDRNGYGRNTVTGSQIDDLNTRAARGTLLFTPTDRLTVELRGDYFRERDRAGGYHFLGGAGFSTPGVPTVPVGLLVGGQAPADVRDISNDADPSNEAEFWGVSSSLTYDLGDDVSVRSLTAYRRTTYATRTDLDATSAPLTATSQFERASQFSQELQLSGRTERLNWLVGAFYFTEEDEGGIKIPFNNLILGFPAPGTFVQGYYGGGVIETEAAAVFGQASYEVVDNLRLTLGVRYSSEEKKDRDRILFDVFTPFDPTRPPPAELPERAKRFESFTPRIAIDYQATPDVLVYGSWSRGFKAGTFNLGSGRDPVEPEEIEAWEAGLKSQLFDRRLRLNLAGFYYDYRDLQVGKVLDGNLVLENAATATIYGLEAELKARVTDRFEVALNASWLHARFDEFVSYDQARPFGDGSGAVDPLSGLPAFDLRDNALSQSPDFTVFVAPQYTVPTRFGDVVLRAEVSWRDRTYFTPFNIEAASQAANTRLNAFINWESTDGRLNGSVFAKNITDETLVGNAYVSSVLVGFPVAGYLEEPRTYGVRLGYNF